MPGPETELTAAGPGVEPGIPLAVQRWRYAIGVLLLLGAFLADLNTGYDLSSSLFYIVPVAFTAWYIGRRPGLVIAVASSIAWFVAQRLEGVARAHPGLLYANAGVECAIYLGTAWALARVCAARITERRLSARLTEAKDALEREFLAVGQLQRGLLPREFPQVEGYDWAVHYATSTRAGGDYYDAFRLPDGRVGVIVADASGHGAPAAVLMAMARALLGADPESQSPPEELLVRLNRSLARMLPAGWFLTVCYAVMAPTDGRFAYSLAGHEAPLIARARDGTSRQLPDRGGLPLGPFPNRRYEAGHAELEPGDILVLFSDGVTEAMSPTHELFGVEGLRAALVGAARLSLEDVKLQVLASLDRHTAGAPVGDDTTILLLRRSGPKAPR